MTIKRTRVLPGREIEVSVTVPGFHPIQTLRFFRAAWRLSASPDPEAAATRLADRLGMRKVTRVTK